MDPLILIMWMLSIIIMIVSIIKRKEETLKALKMSKKIMGKMMPKIIVILFIIGFLMALIPESLIKDALGGNIVVSTVSAAFVGAITIIPAFVAFPLVGSLVESGASVFVAVSFLTTLTMVGVATYPLEKDEFGAKFALTRNLLSFVFAIVIAFAMGVLL